MTKPSYEERRITKHSGSLKSADSASSWVSTRKPSEIRKFVLLVIVAAVWISNAFILEADRLYRTTMSEVAAPDIPAAVGFLQMELHCAAKGDGKTDDADALQWCIDSTSPAPMRFYFPAKTYALGKTLEIKGDRHDILISGATVRGPEHEAALTVFKAAEN
jgi:hypothetical protein